MRVIIATGGTGGHIYPAISLANAILNRDKDSKILFVGTSNRMESKVIPEAGFEFTSIDVVGTNGNVVKKVMALLKIYKATFECKKLMKSFKPDIVIGFGNYISVPVLMAAHKLGIKTMIHEQNSYAGKANKMLGKYVDAIVGSYNENLEQFDKNKTKILGNPRATEIRNAIKNRNVLSEFGLNPNIKTILIVMGSLGSSSVNSVMEKALKQMDQKDYQVIYVTGKNNFDDFAFKSTNNIKIVPYVDGLSLMGNIDLLVARGGATTASEITALGIPSIIIPSPYVPNNHQVKNALSLQDKEASIMIEEKDLTNDTIVKSIESLIFNDDCLYKMHLNAKKIGYPNASDDIIDWIQDLVKVN